MRTRRLFFTLALAAVLTACSYDLGKPLNEAYIGQIERGVTTKQDLRKHMGPPSSIKETRSGTTWQYRHVYNGNFGDSLKFATGTGHLVQEENILDLTFNGDTVKDFTYMHAGR